MEFLLIVGEAIVSAFAWLIPGKKWTVEELNAEGPREWYIKEEDYV